MNVDLDTRLRDSVVALHGSVAPEPPEPPRPSGSPVLAVTAVLAVVAIAAAAFVLSNGDHGTGEDHPSDVAAQPTSAVPRLLADWLPEGFELGETLDDTVVPHGIMSASAESDEVAALLSQAVERSVLFGDPDLEDPYVNGGLDARTIRYVDGTPKQSYDIVKREAEAARAGKVDCED